MNKNIRKFCVAPMMGYTTPHARKLYRILSKNAFLFTEMIPSKTNPVPKIIFLYQLFPELQFFDLENPEK